MRRVVFFLMASLFAAAPLELHAQACHGMPSGSTGSIGVSVGFPDHSKTYSIAGMARLAPNVYGGASYSLTKFDDSFFENISSVGATIGVEVESLRESVSVCPLAGVTLGKWGDISITSIPIGLAVGHTFKFEGGSSAAITPFITPQFRWERASLDNDSLTETFFGVVGGATLSIDQIWIRAGASKLFEEGSRTILSIGFGFGI